VNDVITASLRNRPLARAQLSFGAAYAAEWAFTVAIGLVAYADGGATAVGLVAVVRLVPAALLAPVIGAYADRLPREHVLIASSLLRATATLAAAAVLAAGGPVGVVYGLAVLSMIGFTPFRAAHSALLPSLCRSAEELTGSTVVRGALDSLSLAAGPFAAAALVSAFDVWTVFAFAGALALASSALLLRLRYERILRSPGGRPRIAAEVAEGFRTIARDADLALIIGLTVLQTAIRGALGVFVVVLAIDLLGTGAAGVGWLQGAMGVGALAGSVAVTRLVASRALARWLAVGVILWGAPLVLVGVLPAYGVALLGLAIIGTGNALVDVAVFSLPGRMVADDVLARVFGTLESVAAVGAAAGALLTPVAIEALGTAGALVAVGLVTPACCALAWRRLAQIDAQLATRADEIGILREVPMLRPLPVPIMEQLARHLERVELPAGTQIFAAGDSGDRFYVIERGSVGILDGEELVRRMGAGDGFGEIALLHDVPRTMTVETDGPAVLQAIERDDFLRAITGYGSAGEAARAAVDRHLAHAPGALSPAVR
jgi:MFS family permease